MGDETVEGDLRFFRFYWSNLIRIVATSRLSP